MKQARSHEKSTALPAGLSLACPALAASKTTVVGEAASPELVLPMGSLPEWVCWFADQKYSEGARILQGDIWLACGPLSDLESNGPLPCYGAACHPGGRKIRRRFPWVSEAFVDPAKDMDVIPVA